MPHLWQNVMVCCTIDTSWHQRSNPTFYNSIQSWETLSSECTGFASSKGIWLSSYLCNIYGKMLWSGPWCCGGRQQRLQCPCCSSLVRSRGAWPEDRTAVSLPSGKQVYLQCIYSTSQSKCSQYYPSINDAKLFLQCTLHSCPEQ